MAKRFTEDGPAGSRDIQELVKTLYGVELSATLISSLTDAVDIETFYNPIRLHETLHYLSPDTFEAENTPAVAA